MRFPWLFSLLLVALVAAVAAALLWSRRQTVWRREYVANASGLLRTTVFRESRNKARVGVALIAVGIAITGYSFATLAGAPVSRHVNSSSLASRDIVLCLDASGSMLPYDGEILETFNDMLESFNGERLSLQMWSAQTVVRFPLTDDYELISESLTEGASVISSGYLGEQGDYVLVTQELSEYLEGVDSLDGTEIASLVGDGLASCVLGFDNRDQERSRTIILATDNEVMGDQIYTLQEAVEFATQQNIEIIALYPGNGSSESTLSSEGSELKTVVEEAGGEFYFANDAAAIQGIIERIESTQTSELEDEMQVVETDLPDSPVQWACCGLILTLVGLAWRRV